MSFWLVTLATLLALQVLITLLNVVKQVCMNILSPLRTLPGPENAHLLWGHVGAHSTDYSGILADATLSKWLTEHGSVVTFSGLLAKRSLLTTDTMAVNHVLQHAYRYPKPEGTQATLHHMVGEGLHVADGSQHKRQRKVMGSAFTASHMIELAAIVLDTSIQLRDILTAKCAASSNGAFHTDMGLWLNKITLNIIGLAGFNHAFDTLHSNSTVNELAETFAQVVSIPRPTALFRLLQECMPILRLVPTSLLVGKATRRAQEKMLSLGYSILRETSRGVKEKGGKRPSILSYLLRTNLSEEELVAQILTLLYTGHELPATTLGSILSALAGRRDVQDKLRKEVLSVPTGSPTFDQLDALPYLGMVIRETLRLHAPVTSTVRVATQDDIIPVSKPFRDVEGFMRDYIHIAKGDMVVIPIHVMNTDPAIWGDDAEEFKPERWERNIEITSRIPGVWGNVMSFLGGPRSCIGTRFALSEMKAILFTLIRSFDFEVGVPCCSLGTPCANTSKRTHPQTEKTKLPIIITVVSP
ncbi:cytochrome P450 [Hymenopellis radicata]|nr:cytochrome P450 [Hymenopellis radicata]